MNSVHTRRGLWARIARRWELLNVTLKLRWAERDHKHYAEPRNLPAVVDRLESDVMELREQQALLRNN